MEFFRKKLNKKGFTLIELIVVVAILGILALIAIPRFANLRVNSQAKSNLSTATTILNAAQVYYVEQGEEASEAALLSENYISVWPADQGTEAFELSSGTNAGEYDVDFPLPTGHTTGITSPITNY